MTVVKQNPSPGHLWKKIERGEVGTLAAMEVLGKTSVIPGSKNQQKGEEASALWELNMLVGLQEVKEIIDEIKAYIEIQDKRILYDLKYNRVVLHSIFKGNPGTGKTTVARLLGRIYKGIGAITSGHLVECERADLVGEYIGHTAQKTREMTKKAMGGILFVDEAYSLSRGGKKDFGKEAIDVLVKGMEDHRDDMVLILAGYRDEMDYFMRLNPGLNSRFPLQLDFPDFTISELMKIAIIMATERHYRFSPAAKKKLKEQLEEKMQEDLLHFSNARLVRNILEKSLRRQAFRLSGRMEVSREELITIEDRDLVVEER